MTTRVFSISEALRFGWNTTKSNFGFFVGFLIVFGLLLIVPYIIALRVSEINIFLGLILQIADFALTILVSVGFLKVTLRFCDQEKGRLSDLFSQYRLFFKYFLAYILYGLIVLGGIILFIIPGIIWAIKFQFFPYLIIDKKLGPIEALKQSAAITQGVKWQLWVFSLATWVVNIIGALLLIVGLFVTIPVTMLATAFVYRKLLARTEIATVSQTASQVAFQTAPEAIA